MTATLLSHQGFIQTQTLIVAPALLPEMRLYLAEDVTRLWLATETYLGKTNLPPPFWAFAWPGGLALARYILDNPATVRGKRVLCFAAGSGVDAVAAALAGAAHVTANEIDALAIAAIGLNAGLNGVAVTPLMGDVMGQSGPSGTQGQFGPSGTQGRFGPWDVVIAGDVCYEKPMAERATAWFNALTHHGIRVLVADPGRNYIPTSGMTALASYTLAVSRDLEDKDTRTAVVYAWG